MIDAKGQSFEDTEAGKVLFDTVKDHVDNNNVEIKELDNNINDKELVESNG